MGASKLEVTPSRAALVQGTPPREKAAMTLMAREPLPGEPTEHWPIKCDIRGCVGNATNKVLIEHPMREPFRVDFCPVHLTITSVVAKITISPLRQGGDD